MSNKRETQSSFIDNLNKIKPSEITAETENCRIRMLLKEDYPIFIEGYLNCNESQNRFDDGKINVEELSNSWYCQLLQRRKKEADDDYCYMFNVFCNKTGDSIGYCNIKTIYREDIQCGEIGYTIFNNYWGKGYGTEVVSALTEIGFDMLGFHRLEAYVNLDNPASKAVLRKNGFIFEGVREKYLLEDGVWTDNEVYYKINAYKDR